ncbi:MAG TPA: hypothetical protein VFZ91_14395 [Allosphingosinicella sp.]
MVPPNRIVHPIPARVAPKQDDLEQLARPEARLRPMRQRLRKSIMDDSDDELQLAPLAVGQMVQALLHHPSLAGCVADAKGNSYLGPPIGGEIQRIHHSVEIAGLHAENTAHVWYFALTPTLVGSGHLERHHNTVSWRRDGVGDQERVTSYDLNFILVEVAIAFQCDSGDQGWVSLFSKNERFPHLLGAKPLHKFTAADSDLFVLLDWDLYPFGNSLVCQPPPENWKSAEGIEISVPADECIGI